MVLMALVPPDVLRLTVEEVNRPVEAGIAALRRMPYRAYLYTAHWQRQRAFALEQAENLCELCARGDRLEVHHRSYARVGFERPEVLIVLCNDCHGDHHRALVLRAIRATRHEPLAVTVAEVLEKTGSTNEMQEA
jgi:hypothetical protein